MLFDWIKKENKLVTLQPGLHSKDIATSIGYTDGDSQEARALAILQAAKDKSSTSIELADQCDDRFTTYHFSPVRGNLLRHLKVDSETSILEVGCGFGAITRVLGEKNPAEVIAIEGSLNRAKGANLRCSTLDNVHVLHANMHDILLPEESFDVIVAIGVFEYIKLFYPEDTTSSSEDLVVNFLKKLKRYLKPQGQIVIAIENQLGLKYFLGYEEDHFEEPYVGLYDYPSAKFSSIKTFGQKKWELLFDQAGVSIINLQLPFPDYKFPNTLVEADFLNNAPYSANLLYNSRPANYDNNFSTPVHTNLVWTALTNNHTASHFSDSFLFFVSPSGKDSIVPYDFVHYTSYKRQQKFWSIASKKANHNEVTRSRVAAQLQSVHTAEFVVLPLFAVYLCQLAYASDWELWLQWLRYFNSYLESTFALRQIDHDATFSNVLVDIEKKGFVAFDNEWQGQFDADTSFVLFRSLFYWLVDNIALLSRFEKLRGKPLREAVLVVLQELDPTVNSNLIDLFLEREITISQSIFRSIEPQDFQNLCELIIPTVVHPNTYQDIISQKNQQLFLLAEERFSIIQSMDKLIFERDKYIQALEELKDKSQTLLGEKMRVVNELQSYQQFTQKHPFRALWKRYTKRS